MFCLCYNISFNNPVKNIVNLCIKIYRMEHMQAPCTIIAIYLYIVLNTLYNNVTIPCIAGKLTRGEINCLKKLISIIGWYR